VITGHDIKQKKTEAKGRVSAARKEGAEWKGVEGPLGTSKRRSDGKWKGLT